MRFYIIFCTNVISGLPLLCTDLRFGLPRASSPLQSPICHSCSLLLDFLLPPPLQGPILRYFSLLLDFLVPLLRFKVQSSSPSRSFWTSACLPSASKSILPLLLAPFGLPRASPPPQGPILRYFSLLLDFLLPPLHFKVQSSALSHSFWTSACLPSASRSIPPRSRSPPRKKGGLQSNPPVAINQSNPPSANSTK